MSFRVAERSRFAFAVFVIAIVAVGLPAETDANAQEAAARSHLWEARYNGPADGWDDPLDLAVSPDGATTFVTGVSTGAGTGRDYGTAAYDTASGTQLWAAQYDGPEPHDPHNFGTGWDQGAALAVSPDGNTVFVTGDSESVDTGRDYATIAYDAQSGEQLWLARYNGPGNGRDTPWTMAASPDGSAVFVTGESLGNRTGRDYATVAYDAATGDQLWVARYDGLGWATLANGWDTALDVAVSPNGSRVFVTGYSFGILTNNNEYATVAYNAETGAELWWVRYDSPGSKWDEAFALDVSPDSATVFVTGSSGDEEARDYVTLAYEAASGDQLWEARYAGPTGEWNAAWALATTPDGSAVVVTGGSIGTGTRRDYATLAYDSASGAELWAARYDGPVSGEDLGRAVAVSPDSATVVVTGSSPGVGTSDDFATLAYDMATGDELWIARHGGTGGLDAGQAVTVTPDGSKAVVTGRVGVTGRTTVGIGPPTDWATVTYSLHDTVLEPIDTALHLTVDGNGPSMTLQARLTELSGQNPIPGRTIAFYSGSELIGSEQTDVDGVAIVTVPAGHRGANRTYQAVFVGDDVYEGSSDERPGRSGRPTAQSRQRRERIFGRETPV